MILTVGILRPFSPSTYSFRSETYLQTLRIFGHTEGRAAKSMQVFAPSSSIYNKIWIMYVYSFCSRRLQSSCSLSAYTKRSKRLLFVVLETVEPRLQFFEAHCTVCSERNGSASFTDLWNCLCLFAAHELSSKRGSI